MNKYFDFDNTFDSIKYHYNLDKNKIFVLPFIPPNYILENSKNNNDFKVRYLDWPNEYIIYPSQFWKHKNHENLLKAIGSLKKKGINTTLVLTGKKKYEYRNLLILIKELNIEENIFFTNLSLFRKISLNNFKSSIDLEKELCNSSNSFCIGSSDMKIKFLFRFI